MPGQETTTISMDDRFLRTEGVVYLSGLRAPVRLPIEQQRRDCAAGPRIGTFIRGYPGSPLGGYDRALQQARPMLAAQGVKHVPGSDEELAATAISGTQNVARTRERAEALLPRLRDPEPVKLIELELV